MKRPPVVHVYRHTSGQLWVSAPKDIYSEAVYLGPYVPKASGPPPAIVIHDEARIWALEAEIAKLKAADTRGEIVKEYWDVQASNGVSIFECDTKEYALECVATAKKYGCKTPKIVHVVRRKVRV